MNGDLIFPIIILLPLLLLAAVFIQALYLNVIYPFRQKLKKKNLYGYILTSNQEFEHRAIVERLIKRKLRHGEEVHHINGAKWDNRKSNLALMTREEHLRWHKRLDWMWEKRMNPSIKWQKMKLKSEFGAKLF